MKIYKKRFCFELDHIGIYIMIRTEIYSYRFLFNWDLNYIFYRMVNLYYRKGIGLSNKNLEVKTYFTSNKERNER